MGIKDGKRHWFNNSQIRITALCGLALGAAYLVGFAYPFIEGVAFLAALAVGLIPIMRRAW